MLRYDACRNTAGNKETQTRGGLLRALLSAVVTFHVAGDR